MSEHNHSHNISGKNLFITIVLNIFITIAQIIGGIYSGSLALLSDASHNFSDVLALIIAYVANKLSHKPRTKTETFGYKRAEILAALFNASVLIGIAILLIIEAIKKFIYPEAVNSIWVIGLGLLSIVLNAVSVLLIKDDSQNNMNMKAAYIHLFSDVLTSVAVVVGGVLMYLYKIVWVDPLISLIIAFYLIWASFGLIKDSIGVLMQFVPNSVDVDKLVDFIIKNPEIDNVHHIHLWRLNDHDIHLEAHLDFHQNATLEESNKLIDKLELELHNNFKIEHTTFQCEYNRKDSKTII